MQTAFVIKRNDNVATALSALEAGDVVLTGDTSTAAVYAFEPVPIGHKLSLYSIKQGEEIRKYGVVIGRATQDIKAGTWVHLQCMESMVDRRSSHLDIHTGAPSDISYE